MFERTFTAVAFCRRREEGGDERQEKGDETQEKGNEWKGKEDEVSMQEIDACESGMGNKRFGSY